MKNTDTITSTKTCTVCKETKSLDLFSNKKASKDGKRPNCKACDKAHKDSIKEVSKAWQKANYK